MKRIYTILFALMFVVTISKAQVPNGGFETWTSMGSYSVPDSWGNLNSMTSAAMVYTCEKGTPGSPGASYLKLTSKTIGANVVNGIAVSGTLDTTSMLPNSGLPCTVRPVSLTGKWQHMIYGSSQGSVSCLLTRWDAGLGQRVTVAAANQTLSGMAMSWAAFTINFVYADGGYPDTCVIVLRASGMTPTANDYLWVDMLAFTGSVAGINEVALTTPISILPNPVATTMTVDLSTINGKNVNIEISDISGKMVKSFQQIHPTATTSLDVANLPQGNYILKVITNEGTISKKFIKQ